ncbi:MAG TPA: tetratricopeptide repeat protein, partial [Anaeromyxobacteraceae bacterium]|nr:tetratricopeptide repeat protein [Anaeromyxobacteraceae bacterium]
MRVACPHCPARYSVDDGRIPAGGLNVRCPKCKGVFPVRRASIDPPAAGASGAMAEQPRREERPWQPAADAAEPGAVPLPPPQSQSQPPESRFSPAATAEGGGLAGESAAVSGAAHDPAFPAHDPAFDAFDAPADPTGGLSWTTPIEPFAPPPAAQAPVARDAGVPLPDPFMAASAGPTAASDDPFGDPPIPAYEPPAPDERSAPDFGAALDAWSAPDATPALDERSALDATSALDDPFGTESPASGGGEADRGDAPAPRTLGPLGPIAAGETRQLEALFGGGDSSGGPERTEMLSAAPRAPAAPVAPRPSPVLGRKEEAPGAPDAAPAAGAAPRGLAALLQKLRPARKEPAPRAQRPGRETPGPVRRAPRDGSAAEDAAKRTSASWARRKAPLLAAAAVVALVVGVGVAAGSTRYGFFFYRSLTGQTGPNRPGAALLREARTRLAQGTYPASAAALRLAGQALQQDSGDAEASALFVLAAAQTQRAHGGAANEFSRAPQLLATLSKEAPEDPVVLAARVAAALVPGSAIPLDAEGALERHVAATPGDAPSLLLLGEAAASKRDFPRAASLLQRAAAADPRSPRAPHALGLLLVAKGDRAAAAKSFEDALARSPEHLASAVELAQLALDAGDVEQASSRLDGALAEGPRANLGPRERARARTLRAAILTRRTGGDPAEALDTARKELEAAVADDGGYAPARVALARMLLRRGDAAQALTILGPAASEAPELRARALAADGKLLDATNAIATALSSRPGDARLLYVKGVVASVEHKPADAEKAWAEAVAKDPRYPEPRIALARARLAAGDPASAATELAAAREHAEGDADFHAAAGELALARGDAAAARSAFDRSLQLDPAHAPALVGLARVALAARDDAGA